MHNLPMKSEKPITRFGRMVINQTSAPTLQHAATTFKPALSSRLPLPQHNRHYTFNFQVMNGMMRGQRHQEAPPLPPHSVENRAVSLRWLLQFQKGIPSSYSTQDMVQRVVIPMDSQPLGPYSDTLPRQYVGKVQVYVSHAWQASFKDLVRTLEQHFEKQLTADPTWDVFVWLNVFAITQQPCNQQTTDLGDLNAVIVAAESTLLVLDADGFSLKRMW